MNHESLLALVIGLPLVAAALLALWPKLPAEPARLIALLVALATFVLSLPLLNTPASGLLPTSGGFDWIATLGVRFRLGVDGISAPLVVLTTLLLPIVLLASYGQIHDRIRQYCVLLLAMEAGMVGVFAALDLVLFYVFFEMSLIPLYLLIGIYGGARRTYAAIKFVLFTVAGSLPLLLAIVWLVQRAGSGDFEAIRRLPLTPEQQKWLFAAFAAAFCVKVPLVPLHTWLPDAHVEAPTGGSVILAGVTLKMGTYGLLRFCLPLFPDAAIAARPLLIGLAVVGILYGALLAWAQSDLKKVIACSSVSHLGFVVLGLFAFETQNLAGSGAVLQMINHGLSTGALFLLIGMIYERAHTRGLADFGGLARTMPRFAFCLVFATLSSIGLPGLNGFIGEFLILMGSWRDHPVAASLAAGGVLLGAIYMLGLVKALLFGPVGNPKTPTWRDLTTRELLVLAPLFGLMIWIGFKPQALLEKIEPSVERMLEAPRRELPR